MRSLSTDRELLLGAVHRRVDLEAERATGRLRVAAAWLEAGRDPDEVAEALADELRRMAEWLGLGEITVARRDDLAPTLRAAIR